MKIRRIAALLLAVSLSALFAGCSSGENTKTAAVYNGGEIPAGVYIYYQITAYNEAAALAPDSKTDPLKQEIEGVPAEQWIANRAAFYTRRFAAVESECARLNIVADEVSLAAKMQSIDSAWESEGALLEKNGISRNSVNLAIINNQKLQQLFLVYYDEGGEKAVPESELLSYYRENYRRALVLVIPKYDESTYQALTGDALTERENEIKEYFSRAQSGESIFSLIVDRLEKTGKSTDAEPVESDYEGVLSRQNTSYPADFITRLFEGAAMNTPELYEDDSLAFIFERRELMGDGSNFSSLRNTILATLKGEEYDESLAAMADSIGFSLNDAAVGRYQVSKLVFQ